MPFQPVTADDINTKLRTIESQHQARVLFACESGSRSRSFASPESDYDVRFIFVRRTEDYLAVSRRGTRLNARSQTYGISRDGISKKRLR